MIQVLAIVAHPDDGELLCAGALLHAHDSGYTTGILDLSAGEAGSFGTVGGRREETSRSSSILGLSARATAGLPDGQLVNSPEARAVVASIVRELRPTTVILHWPEARHPDHRAASELGRDACFLAGVRNAAGVVGEPYRPHKLLYALAYQENAPAPTLVLDITAQIERKLEAIFAYGSQFGGKTSMGDVFGSATRPLREQILAHHAHYGSLIRKDYGEPYWTRETVEVGDLVNLAVNSM
jgi:bacillithiol biosynthesis deacetylase BshB1